LMYVHGCIGNMMTYVCFVHNSAIYVLTHDKQYLASSVWQNYQPGSHVYSASCHWLIMLLMLQVHAARNHCGLSRAGSWCCTHAQQGGGGPGSACRQCAVEPGWSVTDQD